MSDRTVRRRSMTFRDLSRLAISIIDRIPGDIEMVSGPISTGGVGSVEGNRRVFERVVEILVREKKIKIFSQMPFEDKMVEFYLVWHKEHPDEDYCMPILDDFYERVFSTGRIAALNFIYGWEFSFGARWEHDNCDRWNIEKRYLPKNLYLRSFYEKGD